MKLVLLKPFRPWLLPFSSFMKLMFLEILTDCVHHCLWTVTKISLVDKETHWHPCTSIWWEQVFIDVVVRSKHWSCGTSQISLPKTFIHTAGDGKQIQGGNCIFLWSFYYFSNGCISFAMIVNFYLYFVVLLISAKLWCNLV